MWSSWKVTCDWLISKKNVCIILVLKRNLLLYYFDEKYKKFFYIS